ncbi:hypothetical protein AVEN_220114-1, partial [Araneus ventricosus]
RRQHYHTENELKDIAHIPKAFGDEEFSDMEEEVKELIENDDREMTNEDLVDLVGPDNTKSFRQGFTV